MNNKSLYSNYNLAEYFPEALVGVAKNRCALRGEVQSTLNGRSTALYNIVNYFNIVLQKHCGTKSEYLLCYVCVCIPTGPK